MIYDTIENETDDNYYVTMNSKFVFACGGNN